MEIRNEIDAKFILKHRATKEVDKYYTKNKTYWFLGVMLIPFILFCIIFDSIGCTNNCPASIGIAFFSLLAIWLIIFLLIMFRREKDIEKMTKKFLEDEKKKGNID